MSIKSLFQNIADAIKEKVPGTITITPAEMPAAIRSISGGDSFDFSAINKILFTGYNKGGDAWVQLSYIEFTNNENYLSFPAVATSYTKYGTFNNSSSEYAGAIFQHNIDHKTISTSAPRFYWEYTFDTSFDLTDYDTVKMYTANDSEGRDPQGFILRLFNEAGEYFDIIETSANMPSTRKSLGYTKKFK